MRATTQSPQDLSQARHRRRERLERGRSQPSCGGQPMTLAAQEGYLRYPLGSQAIQGGQVLPLRDLLRPTARRAAVRRADGRRRRLRREVDGAVRGAALGPRGARRSGVRVWRWRGARPQTRCRSVAEPCAPRRPSCARASGCAHARSHALHTRVVCMCHLPCRAASLVRGGRAGRRVARPPRVDRGSLYVWLVFENVN